MTNPPANRTGRKRANGEGTITLRKDGRWEARVTLPGGKRKTIYGKTQRDVRDQLLALRRAVQDGVTLGTGRQTVAQFLERWLTDVVSVKNKYRTWESYSGLVKGHIAPALGRYRLTALTPQHIQTFVNATADALSPSMAKHCRDVLRIALRQAVKWKLVAYNAAAEVDPPRLPKTQIAALSQEQVKAILAAFNGHYLRMPVMTALSLGLRRGEVLGLRWADVDFDRQTLAVRHQVQKQRGEWRFVEPKSEESRRTLPMPDFFVEALRTHRAEQLEHRLALGPAWQDFDLVFPTEVGTPQDGMNLTHRFQARLKRAGLPSMRYHDLRHGAATMLLAQGASLKDVGAVLGHSDYKSTLVYAHIHPEVLRKNAERMQAALG